MGRKNKRRKTLKDAAHRGTGVRLDDTDIQKRVGFDLDAKQKTTSGERKHAKGRKRIRRESRSNVRACSSLITDEEHTKAVRLLRQVDWKQCENTSRRNVIPVEAKRSAKSGKRYWLR